MEYFSMVLDVAPDWTFGCKSRRIVKASFRAGFWEFKHRYLCTLGLQQFIQHSSGFPHDFCFHGHALFWSSDSLLLCTLTPCFFPHLFPLGGSALSDTSSQRPEKSVQFLHSSFVVRAIWYLHIPYVRKQNPEFSLIWCVIPMLLFGEVSEMLSL